MPIEFGDKNVSLEGPTFEMKFSPKEEKLLNEEIKKLLKKWVIKKSSGETREFISPIFLVPKPPDLLPTYFKFEKTNEHMSYTHVEMETINSILTMKTPTCYIAKLDTKNAYYSFPILEEHQKYLNFLFGGSFISLLVCQMAYVMALENLQNCWKSLLHTYTIG